MKILHTADWHLGKKLDFFSRLEEQKAVLDEICEIADREKVDLVIVAGDLYDNANPSIEAQELLFETLHRLARKGKVPVIAIAGNHDSAERIDSPDILAKTNGILFFGSPETEIKPQQKVGDFKINHAEKGFIELQLPHLDFPIRVLITPFANEWRLKTFLGDDAQKGLNDLLAERWKYLADTYCDTHGVNLLTAHLYFGKRGQQPEDEPDGERSLKVGFSDLVYTDLIPSQIQYTALGHLHKCIQMGSEEKPVMYSSSPLQYSFAEAEQQKYVILIDANPNQNVDIQRIELQSGKTLKRLQYECYTDALQGLLQHTDALVELTLYTEMAISAEERKGLLQVHPNLIQLNIQKKNTSQNAANHANVDRIRKTIHENFVDYYQFSNDGLRPSTDILNLFQEVLNVDISE